MSLSTEHKDEKPLSLDLNFILKEEWEEEEDFKEEPLETSDVAAGIIKSKLNSSPGTHTGILVKLTLEDIITSKLNSSHGTQTGVLAKSNLDEQRERKLLQMRINKTNWMHQIKQEKARERNRLKERRRRANETEEQREKRLQRVRERQRNERANETAEQREERLQRGRERMRRLQESDKELWLKRRQQIKERGHNRFVETSRRRKEASALLEKAREELNEKRNDLTKEELEEKWKNMRELYEPRLQKLWDQLKAQGDLTNEEIDKEVQAKILEEKERKKVTEYLNRANMTKEQREKYRFRNFSYFHNKSEEEKQKMRDKQRRYYYEVIRKDPEKLKKYQEHWRKNLKKYFSKEAHPEKVEERKKRFREYSRTRTATESPEQRQKRLHRYKIYQAKQKLKKQLQTEGVSSEEIGRRLKELADEMWSLPLPPLDSISVYEPKPRRAAKKYRKNSVQSPLQTESSPSTQSFSQTAASTNPDTQSQIMEESPVVGAGSVLSSLPKSIPSESDGQAIEFDELNEPNLELEWSPPPETFHEYNLPIEGAEREETVTNENLCPHCLETVSSDAELRHHIFLSHPKKCWKCPKCKETFLSPPELSEHFRSIHSGNNTSIHLLKNVGGGKEQEAKVSEKTTSGSESLKSKPAQLPFSCVKCTSHSESATESQFATVSELKNHVKMKHPEFFFPCPHCALLKYSEKALASHVKYHSKPTDRRKYVNV